MTLSFNLVSFLTKAMHSQVTQVYFRLLLCLRYFVGRDKAAVGNTSAYSCQARELGLNKHKDVVPSDRHRLRMFLVVKALIAKPQTSEFGLYQIIDFDLL